MDLAQIIGPPECSNHAALSPMYTYISNQVGGRRRLAGCIVNNMDVVSYIVVISSNTMQFNH